MFYITLGIGLGTAAFVLFLLTKRKKERQLKGKTVVIVGASSGIGEACAGAFHRAGCKLVLCARRISELERVKEELLKSKEGDGTDSQIEVRHLDITDSQATRQTLSDISAHILLNNAGISHRGNIQETDMGVHRRIMEVNYFGQVEATKAILPSMVKRGSGHIVFVSSIQGKLSVPFRSAYSASKHAVQAFADCLRAEVHEKGVQVTVVSPGYVRTPLSLSALHADGSMHGVMDANQNSGMSAEEVAERILVAIDNQEEEVLVCKATYRIAVYLRNLFPRVFFKLMNKRALSQEG